MTHVMFHVLIFLSAFTCVYSNDSGIEITVKPSMDAGFITWKQTVVISCNWTPGSRMYGDITVGDGESVYSNAAYADIVALEDPEARVFFTSDDGVGTAELTIKDVTEADEHTFGCQVSRKGSSPTIDLDILEPPLTGVTNFNAVAEFTTVALSWDAVEGATSYNVAWRPAGASDWTAVDVSTNSHTFTDLSVASNFEAKVDASNAAGIREGIEPAETTFTTKDNRPPHPVDNLAISGSPLYDTTEITISWELTSNTDESRIIKSIEASVVNDEAEEGAEAIAPQTLAAEATTATFQLPAHGEYVFTVKTVNDFSEGVETSATVTHTVQETTVKPTTIKPTTPKPTTKAATTKEPTKEPTEKEITVAKVTDAPVPKNVVCGDTLKIEPLLGKSVQLQCSVPDEATYDVDDITWSYETGDDGVTLNHEAILATEAYAILVNSTTKTTTLIINAAGQDNAGSWKCHLDGEFCKYEIILPGKAVGAAFSTALSGTLILASLIVALLR